MRFKLIIIFFYVFCFSVSAQNNGLFNADTFSINLNNVYNLSHPFILKNSISVYLSGKQIDSSEYYIDFTSNTLSLQPELNFTLLDTIIVEYNYIGLPFPLVFQKNIPSYRFDDVSNDSVISVSRNENSFSSESIFGKNIKQSGSLIRGFEVGSNQDLSVTSGLRLQLSGQLTDDIEVIAALTDENTPIQPEGNTETLEELDKVFIQIRHPNAKGTFGDYEYNSSIGEFGNINRKLEGLKAEFFTGNYNYSAAIAGSRGKYNSNQFFGEDGNQGPYRLTGENNERQIIIIAGSEKVFLDGEELKRGDNNDYTIDYANAEITFTPNRLITSAGRITVDFEYTDRRYARNFFGTNASAKILDNKITLKVNYLREGDDENNPIDFSLTDEQRDILEAAGDNRNNAAVDGAVLAPLDSNGIRNGNYIAIDTIINTESFIYYLYNPNDSAAIYNVSFSYVGTGMGDYIRDGLLVYRFVGIGNGSYLPRIYLPQPALTQNANVQLTANVTEKLLLNLEFAGSLHDQNLFSSLDDNNNGGYARNISLNYLPDELNLFGFSLGKAGFIIRDRFVHSRYVPLDRFNSVEFNRNYNINNSDSGDETLREITLNLIPHENLTVNSEYGFLSKGKNFSSNRSYSTINLKTEEINSNAVVDYVSSKVSGLNTEWLRSNGVIEYEFGIVKPGFKILFENKEQSISSDSLTTGSLRYAEYTPTVSLLNIKGFGAGISYGLREEFFPMNGELKKQSFSKLYSVQLDYSGIKEVKSNFTLTLRQKEYEDAWKAKGFLNSETILIRSRNSFNFWDRFLSGTAYYEVSSQKTAKLEKVFVKVPDGTGNYIYLGDLNGNGTADENEFEQTIYEGDFVLTTFPTDELFPVIDFKANTRWEVDFSDIETGSKFADKILNPLSTETVFRVEENSSIAETEKIYLLDFSKFLNDSTTLNGFNLFTQDIYLYKNRRDFSLRWRFSQRRSLNQYSSGTEKGYLKDQNIRLRLALTNDFAAESEYTAATDLVSAPDVINRSREISRRDLSLDLSYRVYSNTELGIKISAGNTTDEYPADPTIIDFNSLLLRLVISFLGKGRLRIETERTELLSNTTENFIPFEATRGNRIGKNYYWRFFFDYKITGNLQANIYYNGRLQGGTSAIHSMRAEVRAYF